MSRRFTASILFSMAAALWLGDFAQGGYEILEDSRRLLVNGVVSSSVTYSDYFEISRASESGGLESPQFNSVLQRSTDAEPDAASSHASIVSYVTALEGGFHFGSHLNAQSELRLTDPLSGQEAFGLADAFAVFDMTFSVDRTMRLALQPLIQAMHPEGSARTTVYAGASTSDPVLVEYSDNSGPATIELDLAPGVYRINSHSSIALEDVGASSNHGNTGSNVFGSLGLVGDFDLDGQFTCEDADALVEAINTPDSSTLFDLNGDGPRDYADLELWLEIAGAENNSSGAPYLAGDANLDGSVDGEDFLAWNANKFTPDASWCKGDFDASGLIDGNDFLIWNRKKFQSVDSKFTVPEPASLWLLALATFFLSAGTGPTRG